MRVPRATYRLQFSPSFGFRRAAEVAPYVAELGISDIYASPVFTARPGSGHGYDVIDPNRLSPELGGEAEFENLMSQATRCGLGWLQDIVPNHLAFDGRNKMLADVLARGRGSPFIDFFDIDWDHPAAGLRGKVLAPFLGARLKDCLEKGEIKLAGRGAGLEVRYHDLSLPLSEETAAELRGGGSGQVEGAVGGEGLKPADLERLLEEQRFLLCHWKDAAQVINYRRFFDVNGLICLRQEDPAVFDQTHRLILELVAAGRVTGLRIDHLDGLYDPANYLRTLRDRVGDSFVIVEKILGPDEPPPADWPVAGTSGYDFLGQVNALFCRPENRSAFEEIYARFAGANFEAPQVVLQAKKLIMSRVMAGEVDNLVRLFKSAAGQAVERLSSSDDDLRSALGEVAARLPVYRTYVDGRGVTQRDEGLIRQAIDQARRAGPDLAGALDFIEGVLLLRRGGDSDPRPDQRRLEAAMRFQQFTGPLAAKGVEDTTLYRFNRLLSLNEVGADPALFGLSLSQFHAFNQRRLAAWPDSLNATSTHDVKRGEDARARLNVLSELPQEWAGRLRKWRAANRGLKKKIGRRLAPDLNEEYFLYQALLGSFPFAEAERAEFVGRFKEYTRKALREAKVNSSWLEPDQEYEAACLAFVERLLDPSPENQFRGDFISFWRRISHFGMLNSLSQTLLKITCPGVPDFYQGAELWDLSLVDPDNRRPVDFEVRRRVLAEMKARAASDPERLIKDLLDSMADGRVKLFMIFRALGARRERPKLFWRGGYLPLEATGEKGANVVAFLRRLEGDWALTLALRFLSELVSAGRLPLGEAVWGGTSLTLPQEAPRRWRDVFTGREVDTAGELLVGRALKGFPVCLLLSVEEK